MRAREKSLIYDLCAFDGANVGTPDPVFGGVVPGSDPEWFRELLDFAETLQMLEVRPGRFLVVVDDNVPTLQLFFGVTGAWQPVARGDRILRDPETGAVALSPAAEFLARFEPV